MYEPRRMVGASSTTSAGDSDVDRSSSMALVSSMAAKESTVPDSRSLHVAVNLGEAKRLLTYLKSERSVSSKGGTHAAYIHRFDQTPR